MADTVTTRTLYKGNEVTVVCTCLSDGTGETGVVKVDKSALSYNGGAPSTINLLSYNVNMQGFASLTIAYDETSDDTIGIFGPGNSYENFEEEGGLKDLGTGGTGDIIFTTGTPAAGATYNVTLRLRMG